MKEGLKLLYSELINHKVRTIDYGILKYKKNDIVNKIKLNTKFKNINKGSRCFIVGNGPSIKNQDLSLLKNEIVFTVNQISRHPDFEKMESNYHFWADPIFFNLSKENPEDMELLEVFKGINTKKNKPVCFLPNIAVDFVERFNLQDELNISFYYPKLTFHDNYDYDFDFSHFIPGFQTVVQYAIAKAIYMGISEIYLLGCDSTGIISTINAFMDEDCNATYGYNISANEQKRLESLSKKFQMESSFYGWARILHLYKELNRYCIKRNVKLVNCSAKTIIDSIPRGNYEDIVEKKELK
ncbi:DUF115 domain-containing protein [Metabacillus litoralis]|uniref:DUF115 domain-containing protein n=1 Tax=Metabacillus litoralis TaxID=152268 RepID=A0A5C6VC60_9BACI|nr:6-hydroxymethylpterin diphosphokinase MptE-like protein [Metabacillus litoralis]TXC82186.1 DUF115 domain-containing protein [Metabacillus litoralis]